MALANETTVAQRLVRAKRMIRDQRIVFDLPSSLELARRLDPVLESISNLQAST